jgi:lysophospholipase L1-like esterase
MKKSKTVVGALNVGPYGPPTGVSREEHDLLRDLKDMWMSIGNSLTAGTQQQYGYSYPNQLAALLPQTCKVANMGVSGRTCAQMLAEGTTAADAFYSASFGKNVLVVWEGRNDCALGATKEQAYTNLATYCAARQSAGWKVIILNCIATEGVEGWNVSQPYINAQIAANWEDYADAFVDVAGDVRLQTTSDATYFSDTVHLTNAGYGVVAALVEPAVTALLNAE